MTAFPRILDPNWTHTCFYSREVTHAPQGPRREPGDENCPQPAQGGSQTLFPADRTRLHVGYRKLASGPGTWVARRYGGEGRYSTENLRTPGGAIVVADDYSDADGDRVLSFAQAQERARRTRPSRTAGSGAYTVANAMTDYLAMLESDGRAEAAFNRLWGVGAACRLPPVWWCLPLCRHTLARLLDRPIIAQ
jgi:hypothetical protein